MRTVWFHRDHKGLTGGHLKHAHYFGHVARTRGFLPRITFADEAGDAALARERRALWPPGWRGVAARWKQGRRDLLFIAGADWRYLEQAGLDALPNPRINLIQGIRHTREGTGLYGYLAHRAVRICVSQEVADAIGATGRVNGPVLVIPNGTDLAPVGSDGARHPPAVNPHARRVAERAVPSGAGPRHRPVAIIGYKAPELAQGLAERLASAGIEHRALTAFVGREEYLDLLAESRVAVCLPLAKEGFYLPALEAMALGCVVVTLDCIGNRGFCRHEQNCLVAERNTESLHAATTGALNLPEPQRLRLRKQAAATAANHSLTAERDRFREVLRNIDGLWEGGE